MIEAECCLARLILMKIIIGKGEGKIISKQTMEALQYTVSG